MKNIICYSLIFVIFISCQKKVSAADVPKINGYWEIEKVIFPDGNKKEYTINETYDYFQIKDGKGFRKKVMPQLDGTFIVNDSDEKVIITNKDGAYSLHYSTSFAKWDESLIAVSEKELITRNNSNKEYHYKRAAPINIIPHAKASQ